MKALEAMILKLTQEIPSGGICRVGPVSFSVWYCSDIWEWEYQGESYWDAQDLAEAIIRDHRPALRQGLSLPDQIKTKGMHSTTNLPVMVTPVAAGGPSKRRCLAGPQVDSPSPHDARMPASFENTGSKTQVRICRRNHARRDFQPHE
jgi:hypothetical protein